MTTLTGTDSTLDVVVSSDGEGTMKVALGSLTLGTMDLGAGTDSHTFTLSSGALSALQLAGAGGLPLTLTPIGTDGVKGTAVTGNVVLVPTASTTAKLKPAKHAKPAKPASKKTKKVVKKPAAKHKKPGSRVGAVTALDGIWLARPERPAPGTPVAVKDLLDTAGLVTTYGSILFAEHVPAHSAEAVLRLEAAGYAVAGKTNLHEFAYGISSQNPHFGTVPNPRAPGRLAGGSSGGSAAAIAAGDVELALGTDSGGSIRIPAAWCGIVGFKPTFDLVPADGCFPLAPSYDHVGPMASTVRGLRRADAGARPRLRAGRARVAGGGRGRHRVARPRGPARPRARRGGGGAVPAPAHDRLPARRRRDRLFMREVADVHRGLFPETPTRTATTSAPSWSAASR